MLHSNSHRLALVVLAAITVNAQAFDGIVTLTSGAHFYKRVVTNANPQTTSTEQFEVLPGAQTTVFVPPQTEVLINVGFSAETACYGGDVIDNWCEAAITIGGTEGHPMASTYGPDTFAMASTDRGSATAGSWESHAFTRHRCMRNTTNAPLAVPVAVNWKVTNFAGMPPTFWVDDSALVVEMARGCSESQAPDGGRRGAYQPPASGQR